MSETLRTWKLSGIHYETFFAWKQNGQKLQGIDLLLKIQSHF